ncbi:MAG: rod shape-determining protein MreD [Pseudomonadota bacterium]
MSSRWWPLLLAGVVGLGVASAPLPAALSAWRPDLALLVVIYVAIHQPRQYVIAWAVITGVLLDAQHATPLGQYALAHIVAVYLPLRLHQRLVLLPVWQSTLSVILFTALAQFVLFWCNGATGNNVAAAAYIKPMLANAICWPPLMLALDTLRLGQPQRT